MEDKYYIKKLTLNSFSDGEYKRLCIIAEKTGVFKACGNTENKWLMLRFKTKSAGEKWFMETRKVLQGKRGRTPCNDPNGI